MQSTNVGETTHTSTTDTFPDIRERLIALAKIEPKAAAMLAKAIREYAPQIITTLIFLFN